MGEATLSPLAMVVAAVMAGIVLIAAIKLLWGMALWAKRSEHRVGDRWGEEAVEVVEWSGREGYVRAGGELWRATGAQALRPGDRVRVARTRGLSLEVKPIPSPQGGESAPSDGAA